MIIRKATLADIPVISRLAEDIWWPSYGRILSDEQIGFMLRDMYSHEALTRQMESGNTFLLALRDELPTAFASYSLYRTTLHIHKLYVLPGDQGKGTGRQLINHLEEIGLAQHATELELNVNRGNPALGFYQKCGFEISETVDIPYHHFVLNDYVMRKPLP